MNMVIKLEAIPDGIFNANYTVFENDIEVAKMTRKLMSLKVQGKIFRNTNTYNVYRDGVLSGPFNLESESGIIIASAKRKGFLSPSFLVDYAGYPILIKLNYLNLVKKYMLFSGETKIGLIRIKNIFSRRVILETYREVPSEIRLFILWLAIVLITSRNDSSHATNI